MTGSNYHRVLKHRAKQDSTDEGRKKRLAKRSKHNATYRMNRKLKEDEHIEKVGASSHSARMKEYRDKKKSTPKGHEEMKAEQRIHSARGYRNKKIKDLTHVQENLMRTLQPRQKKIVDEKVDQYKVQRAMNSGEGVVLTLDQLQYRAIQMLDYTNQAMREVINEDNKELHDAMETAYYDVETFQLDFHDLVNEL